MLLRKGERKQQQLPTEWIFKNANNEFNLFNLKKDLKKKVISIYVYAIKFCFDRKTIVTVVYFERCAREFETTYKN